jgi:hypothetical protein
MPASPHPPPPPPPHHHAPPPAISNPSPPNTIINHSQGLSLTSTPDSATTSSTSRRFSQGDEPFSFQARQGGRSKTQRWSDDSSSGGSSHKFCSFKEALVSGSRRLHSLVTTSSSAPEGVKDKKEKAGVVEQKQLVESLRDELGWQVVERRKKTQRVHLPRRGSLVDLRGRCFNCFSSSHLAAACRRSTRCFRCFDFGHQVSSCPTRPVARTRQCGGLKQEKKVDRIPVWQRLTRMVGDVPLRKDGQGSRPRKSVWKRISPLQEGGCRNIYLLHPCKVLALEAMKDCDASERGTVPSADEEKR